ncbi:TetR family transcriptional regulator [Solidesulfovibrio fructosivorans JJ]]|uniref:TetR family transcriptional regulator n=1 Tax=Solidesulfovibrio fructosivorans JJ] TaxID=596151 RepID=E1JSU7_SOLFR|nr:hypothetical protein [Solidesulfovibrio fructosivorans]EFL52580.1 TetR family transcriptional regulator [Solidesulfovibrio fructosivorans JJ]]
MLRGAEGTALERVRRLLIAELTRLAADYPKRSGRGEGLSPATLFVLNRVFVGTVDMIVAILQAHEDGKAIREAFTAFWHFQLKGLQSSLSRDASVI